MKINKKFIELIQENPELEVKFMISGECNEDDNYWYVGEIMTCSKGIYIEYADRVYDDIEDVKESIREDLWSEETKEISDYNYDLLVDIEFKKIESEEVIWVYIGV